MTFWWDAVDTPSEVLNLHSFKVREAIQCDAQAYLVNWLQQTFSVTLFLIWCAFNPSTSGISSHRWLRFGPRSYVKLRLGISPKFHRYHILLCANLVSFKTRLFATFQISPIWKNIFTNGLFSTNRTPMNTAFCEGFCLTLLQLEEPSNLSVKFFVTRHGTK